MNDREMLELAAKAARLTVNYRMQKSAPYDSVAIVNDTPWNPLKDDGDAFRLARILSLTVDFNEGAVRKPNGALLTVGDVDIRLSIVRAAAEIGKEK